MFHITESRTLSCVSKAIAPADSNINQFANYCFQYSRNMIDFIVRESTGEVNDNSSCHHVMIYGDAFNTTRFTLGIDSQPSVNMIVQCVNTLPLDTNHILLSSEAMILLIQWPSTIEVNKSLQMGQGCIFSKKKRYQNVNKSNIQIHFWMYINLKSFKW